MKKLLLIGLLSLTGCFSSKYSIGDCFIETIEIGQIAGKITGIDKENKLYTANIYFMGAGPASSTRPIKDADEDTAMEKVNCSTLGL